MQIKKVGVVGCGLMGHGIVQVAAQGGFEVVALESDAGALETPLANHNYLRAIVAGYSEKQQAADERKQEDARAGRTPVGRPPAPPPFKQAPPKQPRAERTTQDFETLYAAIGRGMQQEKPE